MISTLSRRAAAGAFVLAVTLAPSLAAPAAIAAPTAASSAEQSSKPCGPMGPGLLYCGKCAWFEYLASAPICIIADQF